MYIIRLLDNVWKTKVCCKIPSLPYWFKSSDTKKGRKNNLSLKTTYIDKSFVGEKETLKTEPWVRHRLVGWAIKSTDGG